jgi:hypothetical protein
MALSVADAGWVTKGGGQKPIVRCEFAAVRPQNQALLSLAAPQRLPEFIAGIMHPLNR